MGIEDDPYLAWQFNRAVWLYGHRVDQLLEEKKEVSVPKPKTRKGHYVLKPKYTLSQALRKAARRDNRHAQVQSDFDRMRELGVTSMID